MSLVFRVSLQILARQNKPRPLRLCVSRSWRMLLSRVAVSSMSGVSTLPAMTTVSAVPTALMKRSSPVLSVALTPRVVIFLRLRLEPRLPRRRNIPLQIRLHLLHLQSERPLHLENFAALIARNQRGSHAFFARASRS